MTKEELEKATGQELIEQRNYCGVDGYYGDYLDDVNAEMLKRFNRLVELEKENTELKDQIKKMKCDVKKELGLLSKLSQLRHHADDPFTCDEYLKLIKETETFLKELE